MAAIDDAATERRPNPMQKIRVKIAAKKTFFCLPLNPGFIISSSARSSGASISDGLLILIAIPKAKINSNPFSLRAAEVLPTSR